MNTCNTLQLSTPPLMRHAGAQGNGSKKLRVVTFNYLPSAYKFVTDWIHENGREHVLAVTSPGLKTRATPAYKDVLPLIPSHVNTIVTSRMNSVLAPILPQFKPDIILCFTFAHRVGPEICQIPTYGAVNIHPSVLPLYRGPNPLRQFYEGADIFGATAHRMAEGYDTGEILSQEYEPMPEIATQATAVRWGQLIKKCIATGMERAISGQPGIVQDDSRTTYAAPYNEEEKWIDLTEPTAVIMRKTLGLNLAGGLAKTIIQGRVFKIHSAHYVANVRRMPAGSIIKQGVGIHEVATADGAVKLITELYDADKKYGHVLPSAMFFGQQVGSEYLSLSAQGV